VIGELRKRIEIRRPERAADGAGGALVAWSTVETVWAGLRRLPSVRDLSGDRNAILRRIAATIRARSAVRLGQRVRVDGVDYEITSIESEGERDKRLTLICEEMP
jgi:SPP1 family predicted phage head-tail adaptor